MANRDNPNGLTPRRHLSGGCIRTESVTLISSNAAIGIGDPLIQAAGGYDRATASSAIAAVAAEAASASSGATILVYRDPSIVYTAQTDDGTGTATQQSVIDNNIDFVIGTPSNGRSIMELDESSATTTATLPFKVIGLWGSVDNSFGQFNQLEVIVNNHKNKGGTGTLGVA